VKFLARRTKKAPDDAGTFSLSKGRENPCRNKSSDSPTGESLKMQLSRLAVYEKCAEAVRLPADFARVLQNRRYRESARLVKDDAPFQAEKQLLRATRKHAFRGAARVRRQQKIDYLSSIPGNFSADRGVINETSGYIGWYLE
jgi:hypothetical protein